MWESIGVYSEGIQACIESYISTDAADKSQHMSSVEIYSKTGLNRVLASSFNSLIMQIRNDLNNCLTGYLNISV